MEGRVCPLSELLRGEELTDSLALLYVAPVWQHSESGAKLFELLLPVVERAVGGDHQERTPNAFGL